LQSRNGYKYKRKEEYPSIADQLDQLWHAMDNGEIPVALDFHKSIKEVKFKHPKSENQ
jgi:hypothetical protein